MHPNDPNNRKRIILKDESFILTGILYRIHNHLGRFLREKQYADALEAELQKEVIPYEREKRLSMTYDDAPISSGIVDFLTHGKIAIDVKAKKFITKDDYYQMLRYLQSQNIELGLVVNFRNTYLKPKRVLNSRLNRDSDNSDASHSYHSGRLNK